ncbi:MAG: lysostaphin resistance A-like protein [Candidatus Odinarchaeia archaeon]
MRYDPLMETIDMESADTQIKKDWNAAYALVMWCLGFLILITFSYLQIINVWLARVLTEVFIGMVPILFVISLFKGTIKDLGLKGLNIKETLLGIAGGVAGVIVGSISFQLEVLILGGIPESFLEYQSQFIPQSGFELFIWICFSMIIVGPFEEIFARGFIQKGLEKNVGTSISLILASILFGALHLDVYRIFPTAMEGLILGSVYVYSNRKSSASAISHGILNSIIFTLMFFFPNYYGL